MEVVQTILFKERGPKDTEATLRAALERGQELGITQYVVATTTGRAALEAAEVIGEQGQLIGIHLSHGLWEQYAAPNEQVVAEAEAKGVSFLVCPHVFTGAIDSALANQGAVPLTHVIAQTYYTIGLGVKACVENVLMAADAGLLQMTEEVISIAGTGAGSDTAVVICPAYSNNFFDLRLREIIAKPR